MLNRKGFVLLVAAIAAMGIAGMGYFANSAKQSQTQTKQLSEQLLDLEQEKQTLTQEKQTLQQELEQLKAPKGGISEHGRLTVKGTQITDENGQPLILRGFSSHGIAWYPEYTNYKALQTIKEYGANVFRVAMYPDQNDGYLEEPELNKKLLYAAVENSLAADLYTIVDWHVLRDENPNRHAEHAVQVFEEVAKRYGNEPGIIYEICNEPNGDTTYEDIAEYANKVIPVIRKYAPDAIILVGTPKYCTSLSEAIENPLPYDNIMYTYHYYAGVSDCKFALKEISNAMQSQLPVFVSEWGLDYQEQTQQGWDETKQFLDFLSQNHIGWVNWALSNKDEGYSLVQSNVQKLYGWSKDELTPTGQFVLEYLQR